MSEPRRGFILGASAYVLWGALPLYWAALDAAAPSEILAHRILWSLLFVVALLAVRRRMPALRRLLANRRARWALAGGAVAIGVNWFTYIWAVDHDRVVEVSLGYYINPLVTVALGVVVLKERLRAAQWLALGIAAVAVLWLALEHGQPPWVSLALAGSFATYGFAKKTADAGAVEGMTLETAILAPLALGYLLLLQAGGEASFAHNGLLLAVLLAGTGLVTGVPQLCFSAAATRISLSTIGLLQYLAPTLQFVLGVVVFREHMSTARWGGFVLVWVALMIFTIESLRHRRRELRRAAEAAAI